MSKQFIPQSLDPDVSLILQELAATNVVFESENANYSACNFQVFDAQIAFRAANITPKKIGQFVALWKRGAGGTLPFDMLDDPFDFIIISVRAEGRLGVFIFPKGVLAKRDIFSKGGMGGKRGFRVYPPWDLAPNQQAKRTQSWQVQYFFELAPKNEKERAVEFIKTGLLV